VPTPAKPFGRGGEEGRAQLGLSRLEAGNFGAEFGKFVGRGYGMHGRLLIWSGKGSQEQIKKV
jgi:hypothetical protein